jgi:hypothetical protein
MRVVARRWLLALVAATPLALAGCTGGAATDGPTCSDGVANGGEADVDCGGPCAPCQIGATCSAPGHCASGACCSGSCRDLQADAGNCGTCGAACSLANAASTCAAGSCAIVSCAAGFDDCDGSGANGCEVGHGQGLSGYAGGICGDGSCGFLCPGSSWRPLLSAAGRTERTFTVSLDECSACTASLHLRATLTPPPGFDYDLRVEGDGGVVSSRNPGYAVEQVTYTRTDDPLVNDGHDVNVEVIYVSGAGCGEWTITLEGTDC